jgi:RHS repeat-associated protein
VGELRYFPHGKTRYTDGTTPTSRRFAGQVEDATIGLYFYNARYYDPALGRFVQADTIVPEPENPQAHNRYAHVANNPLRYSNPTGHGWFDELLITWGQSGSIGRATLVSMSEAAQGLVDPERSPSMEGIRQTVGKGVEAVGMAGAVADYTVQAASEGRWGDAARGTSGLVQMSGAAIAKSPEMAAQYAEGMVVGPFANAWDFGVSMRECAQGTRSGWDVAYHGLGVAATMLGIGSALQTRQAAGMADSSSSRTYAPRVLSPRDPGLYHNFPYSFDDTIFSQGTRTAVSESYFLYELEGSINGVQGTYQLGVKPMESGGELIVHRFFQPK